MNHPFCDTFRKTLPVMPSHAAGRLMEFRYTMAEYPKEMDGDLADILGRPNFWCGPIANLFRLKAGAEIPNKSEAEQAYVLHWLIGLYLEHGRGWRDAAQDEIDRLRAAVA